VVKESALVYVSKPNLSGVGKNREDDSDENPSPRKEGKSADRVT
jgi:hypothetical protein